jgi:hypothetical protein
MQENRHPAKIAARSNWIVAANRSPPKSWPYPLGTVNVDFLGLQPEHDALVCTTLTAQQIEGPGFLG